MRDKILSLCKTLSVFAHRAWPNVPNGLYVMNYHRVGDLNATEFDPNVFSCTSKAFREQVVFYKKNFTLISPQQIKSLIDSKEALKSRYLIITFDDAYRDNFDIAYPILKEEGVNALFFIPTDFIETNALPWWDEIAWIVRKTEMENIYLKGWNAPIVNDKANVSVTIKKVLRDFKYSAEGSIEFKMEQMRGHVSGPNMVNPSNLFMTWGMIKEMHENGMFFGSHSCSHNLLSKMSLAKQMDELTKSKNIIESKLGKRIESFAYPVGSLKSYSKETSRLVQKSGYDFAFNFETGINKTLCNKNFELNRLPVNVEHDIDDLRVMLSKNARKYVSQRN